MAGVDGGVTIAIRHIFLLITPPQSFFFYAHHGFLPSVKKSVILSTAEQFLINSQEADKEGTSITLNTSVFSLCNMKQLNFRHFNTNSKKFFETVIFFSKEAKTAPNRPTLICLVYQGVFGHFTTIPDYFRRSPKATDDSEDCRRFRKTNEEVRPLPKMSEEPSKHLTVFSSETVNIKKLANLTANMH